MAFGLPIPQGFSRAETIGVFGQRPLSRPLPKTYNQRPQDRQVQTYAFSKEVGYNRKLFSGVPGDNKISYSRDFLPDIPVKPKTYSAHQALAIEQSGTVQERYDLASSYLTGLGIQANAANAQKLFQQLANKGHTLSSMELARMEEEGALGPANLVAAAKRYQKLLASDLPDLAAFHIERLSKVGHDNPVADMARGDMYQFGIAVPKDLTEAQWWYVKSADAGLPEAKYQASLGLNRLASAEKNARSRNALLSRAEQYYDDALRAGYDIDRDAIKVEQIKRFVKVKVANVPITSIDDRTVLVSAPQPRTAELNVVNRFSRSKTYTKAEIDHLMTQGSQLDKYTLATSYATGMGVVKDQKLAIQILEPLADDGHALSMLYLGELYEQGSGTRRQFDNAAQLYFKLLDGPYADAAVARISKLAVSGNGISGLKMGDLFNTGTVVKQDKDAAIRWYRAAADWGIPGAATKLSTEFKLLSVDAKNHGTPERASYFKKLATKYAKKAERETVQPPSNPALQKVEKKSDVSNVIADNGHSSRDITSHSQKAVNPAQSPKSIALQQRYEEAHSLLSNPARKDDIMKAITALGDISKDGHQMAALTMGEMYEAGTHVPKNLETAADYYYLVAMSDTPVLGLYNLLKLAKSGVPRAQSAIGDSLQFGLGVLPNQDSAHAWYLKAANGGDASAAYQVSRSFERIASKQLNAGNARMSKESLRSANHFMNLADKRGYKINDDLLKARLTLTQAIQRIEQSNQNVAE